MLEIIKYNISRSLRGSVDWNTATVPDDVKPTRRSLRGSVDWNQEADKKEQEATLVAPFAGAWIEIPLLSKWFLPLRRRSLRGSVDWNSGYLHHGLWCYAVAPFAGAWIEIWLLERLLRRFWRRSLRGSVDWNKPANSLVSLCRGRSLRGSVDWNTSCFWLLISVSSRSLRGSVDWNMYASACIGHFSVAPFAGVWIEISTETALSLKLAGRFLYLAF